MNLLPKICLFLSILPLSCLSAECPNSDFIENPSTIQLPQIDTQLHCECWRLAVEANNLGTWKTIPEECREYVQEYMTGEGYEVDVRRVSEEAGTYARSVNLSGDGKDAWIFDVDETLLSNLPYYAQHGFGAEVFDSKKFDEWVETGMAPAIQSSLKLYNEVVNLGFSVILLTGRSERHLDVTVDNLSRAGFGGWTKLILRSSEDHGKTAIDFKSSKRNKLVEEEGCRLLGNSGDQWSDLLGSSMSERSFKVSNPMYYIG